MKKIKAIVKKCALVTTFLTSYLHGEMVNDRHSFANIKDVITTHLDLDLVIDFDQKLIRGVTDLAIKNLRNARELILDTNHLLIKNVAVKSATTDYSSVQFHFGESDPILGTPLFIPIDSATTSVRITYESGTNAGALQWLQPGQTATKTQPFLFTQGYAIHTRSWIPCQDAPQVKVTYNATTRVIGANTRVVMAAKDLGDGKFAMPRPIPTYLIALAAGNLSYRKIGPRSGVYAEPTLVDAAAEEFADVELMIDAADHLFCPYVDLWDEYNMLILPPGFPFGGMENPMVTFLHPTIIAYDKSLVNVVAHELAHSWMGNLVTNATWADLWVNEGFTTYAERRIVEALYGKEATNLAAKLGEINLQKGYETRDPKLHAMSVDLIDPDDATTIIAYERGYAFLATVERILTREIFDKFLQEYISKKRFASVHSSEMKEIFAKFLKENSLLEKLPELQIEEWIYSPSKEYPSNYISQESKLYDEAIEEAKKTPELLNLKKLGEFNTQALCVFLASYKHSLSKENIAWLEQNLALSKRNAEIKAVWFLLVIKNNYRDLDHAIEDFLIKTGRGKFIYPIYRALLAKPDTHEFAKEVFAKAKDSYHPIAIKRVTELLSK